MEIQKLIADIFGGKVRLLSFDDTLNLRLLHKDSCRGAAGVLCALNFARLAFAAEGALPVLSRTIGMLSSVKTVENAFAICPKWDDGEVRLDFEDLYHIPVLETALKLVSTDYDPSSIDHITESLENLRVLSSSSAIIITRYPDAIACLRFATPTQEVFVLFDPRVIPGSGQLASLTFCTSLSQIVKIVCDIFPSQKKHSVPKELNRHQQANLAERCTGHVFVPKATARDPPTYDDSLIVASVTLLTLKAELEQLKRGNGNLKMERQRLEKNIVNLRAQLKEEETKVALSRTFKSLEVKSPRVTSLVQDHQLSNSTGKHNSFFDIEDEIDPNVMYALQLQASFDSENDFLLKQKHELTQTTQRQYRCGVCLDDFPEDDAARIDACGHEICRGCAYGHVCTKIEEHRFPVLCPVCMADNRNQQPGIISGTLVQILGISEEQWGLWVEMELAQFSIPFTCRRCRHSAFVDKQDLQARPEIQCPFPACDHAWCTKCQQTIDPKGSKHSCDGTLELDHLMKQQGWRYCPNCKTPIQKAYGCNHLSCISPGCNTHFCYGCGQVINRTAIPREIQEGKTAHFRGCALK